MLLDIPKETLPQLSNTHQRVRHVDRVWDVGRNEAYKEGQGRGETAGDNGSEPDVMEGKSSRSPQQ